MEPTLISSSIFSESPPGRAMTSRTGKTILKILKTPGFNGKAYPTAVSRTFRLRATPAGRPRGQAITSSIFSKLLGRLCGRRPARVKSCFGLQKNRRRSPPWPVKAKTRRAAVAAFVRSLGRLSKREQRQPGTVSGRTVVVPVIPVHRRLTPTLHPDRSGRSRGRRRR